MASQADAKSKANKLNSSPSPTGEKNENFNDLSASTVNNLQYVVNVRGLALLEEYCCSYRPVENDFDSSIQEGSLNSGDYIGIGSGSGPGSGISSGSAAIIAKEQHDRYRSSLTSPSYEQMNNKKQSSSRTASTTRNLSIAMHMTSAATSAAGSAVRAYGASYFKNNNENEKPNKSPGSCGLTLTSHPLLEDLTEKILNSDNINSKNVDMLIAVERVCVMLGGCRVTFCKSGKDRTGMAVTYEQSRQIGERFGCGQSSSRILKDANIMR